MTKEFVKGVSYADLQIAYAAYNNLMIVYENTCGGPYNAQQHKEYFAVCDSRDNIRQEVVRRANLESHGEQ